MSRSQILTGRAARRTLLGGIVAGAASFGMAPVQWPPRPRLGQILAQSAAPKRGGSVIVSSAHDSGADPQGMFGFWINGLYAETLTSVNAAGEIIPFLAERWDVSPDVRTYIFTLREGITFHNGRGLTAEDVAWSLGRVQDPATKSPYGPLLADVTIEAVDDRTVRLTSAQPDAALPTVVMMCSITAPESMNADGSPGQMIGTGPFMFAAYVAGDELRTVRNDGYWRGAPFLDGVVHKFIPDPSARTSAIRSGAVDIDLDFQPLELGLIAGDPDLIVQQQAFPYVMDIGFNVKDPQEPLADVRVRRALVHALDRQALLEAWVGPDGPGRVDNQHYGVDSIWRLDLPDPFQQRDLDEARRLLAEAGIPDGFSTIVLSWPDVRILAEVAQAQLREVGIDFTIDMSPDYITTTAKIQDYAYGFVFHGYFPWYDPAIQYGWFHPARGSYFAGGYDDQAFARLLDEARAITEVAPRKALYEQAAAKLMYDDVVDVFLFTYGYPTVHRADLRDYNAAVPHLNPAEDGYGLKNAWLDR